MSSSELAGIHTKTMDITTRREYMNLAKSLFQWALDNEYLEKNPVIAGLIPAKKGNALMNEVDRCYDVYKQLLKEDNLSHECWAEGIEKLKLDLVTTADIMGTDLHYGKKNRKRDIMNAITKQTLKRIDPEKRYTVADIQRHRKGTPR